MLDSTIRSVEQVGSKLGLPLLGLLPLVKFKTKKTSREQALKEMTGGDNPHFSESIRTIRTGIMLSAIDSPHKMILVTSSLPGEGKSTVAANLAITLGKMEKVLLIDADMRRPTIKKHIGVETTDMGLSELVAGTAELKETIHKNSEFGIDVMHAGMIPPNPLELISSKRFSAVMDALEGNYDRIIIDSTPVQAVSDALVLSQYASGLIFVVKSDSTSDRLIKGCLKRLREVNAPIIGVVLNQVDVNKKSRYGYGYGGYYDQYGYSSGGEKT
jgi:capsular exopolysaccharide synthesis family protein